MYGLGLRDSTCSSIVKTCPQAMSRSNMLLRSIAATASSALSALDVSATSAVGAQVVEPIQVDGDDEIVSIDVTQTIDTGARPRLLFPLKILSSEFSACTPPFNMKLGSNKGKKGFLIADR